MMSLLPLTASTSYAHFYRCFKPMAAVLRSLLRRSHRQISGIPRLFEIRSCFCANASTTGESILHGAHQDAQKSTSTGLSACNTSVSKFSVVISTTLIFIPPFFSLGFPAICLLFPYNVCFTKSLCRNSSYNALDHHAPGSDFLHCNSRSKQVVCPSVSYLPADNVPHNAAAHECGVPLQAVFFSLPDAPLHPVLLFLPTSPL